MSKRNALVSLPLLVELGVVDKDDKGGITLLEVNLVLGSLAASHCEWRFEREREVVICYEESRDDFPKRKETSKRKECVVFCV